MFIDVIIFSLWILANSCNGTMCHINATCVNSTEYAYGMHCECNIGFDGDGINCTSKYIWYLHEKISPLLISPLFSFLYIIANTCNGTMCHVNATCVNSTKGGVHCECNTGFDGNGINCTSKYISWFDWKLFLFAN